jgi:hypothetical protein
LKFTVLSSNTKASPVPFSVVPISVPSLVTDQLLTTTPLSLVGIIVSVETVDL